MTATCYHTEKLLIAADRCVKCGLCLADCPTYLRSRDEAESPRGRIALIQALLDKQVNDRPLHLHLNRCLSCRSCEAACPSGVPYGQLIDGVRTHQNRHEDSISRFLQRLRLYLLSRSPYWRITPALLAGYRSFGLSKVVEYLGGPQLRRISQLLPSAVTTDRHQSPTPSPNNKQLRRVGLFTGCVGRLTDQRALQAAITLFDQLQIEVVVPPTQGCCGAMHQHSGAPEQAHLMTENNRRAFNNDQSLDAVVSVASGCASHLQQHLYDETQFRVPVKEVCSALHEWLPEQKMAFRPLQRRVAVHLPCSLTQIPDSSEATLQLLRNIPDIELLSLPQNSHCCGAAGLYLLTQPEIADDLRDRLLIRFLREHQPEVLVSSNTGCMMHLAAAISQSGRSVQVMHPVELLAMQLER